MQFTAVFEQVPEDYIAFVDEIPGANTQGETVDEARHNLVEESLVGRRIIRERPIRKMRLWHRFRASFAGLFVARRRCNLSIKILAAALTAGISSAILAAGAIASPITIQATGIVDVFGGYAGFTETYFNPPPSAGTPVTYVVTYDPALATNNVSTTPYWGEYPGVITSSSISFGGGSYAFPTPVGGSINIYSNNGSLLDIYSSYTFPVLGGTASVSAGISVGNGPAGLFPTLSLPLSEIDLSEFGAGNIYFYTSVSHPGTGYIDGSDGAFGHITGLAYVPSPVTPPLPKISDLAQMSQNAYDPIPSALGPVGQNNEYRLLMFSPYSDDGFQAVAYRNDATGQAVIAFKGVYRVSSERRGFLGHSVAKGDCGR